jgi:MAPEG family
VRNKLYLTLAQLTALHAGVPNGTVNGLCLTFTLVRIGYAMAYIVTENAKLSYIRSVFWWAGNFTCFALATQCMRNGDLHLNVAIPTLKMYSCLWQSAGDGMRFHILASQILLISAIILLCYPSYCMSISQGTICNFQEPLQLGIEIAICP